MMDKPKRVLMVSYHFPPRPGIASLRSGGLAKYLPRFGWEMVVVTPHLPQRPAPGVRVLETDTMDVIAAWKKRLGFEAGQNIHQTVGANWGHQQRNNWKHRVIGLGRELIAYPDAERGWFPYAVESASEILRTEEVDVILSTSPPATAHLVAHTLKKRFGVPWVADFRDLWTQYHYYSFSALRKRFEQRLEYRTLRNCDAITTISGPLADTLARLHHAPVHAIPNGFDPDDMALPGGCVADRFTIIHAGQLYQGRRDPAPFLQALSELLEQEAIEAADVDVRFYGPIEPWLDALIERYGLQGLVRQVGTVSRPVAVDAQRSAQMLLLLTWSHPAEEGVYTGKVFEYLAARRPILSIGRTGGVLDELIRTTQTGYSYEASDVAGIRQCLLSAYKSYRRSRVVPYCGDAGAIQKFSHLEMADRFSRVLDQVSS